MIVRVRRAAGKTMSCAGPARVDQHDVVVLPEGRLQEEFRNFGVRLARAAGEKDDRHFLWVRAVRGHEDDLEG
jgi:hypothetical protein